MKFIKATKGSLVLLGWKRIIYRPLIDSGSIRKIALRDVVNGLLRHAQGQGPSFMYVAVVGKCGNRPHSYNVYLSSRRLYIGCCEFDEETTKKILKWLDIPF